MKKVTVLLFDFSRVLLFAKERGYTGLLNPLHARLMRCNKRYGFFDYFELNEELLKFLEKIKDKFDLFIFTAGLSSGSSPPDPIKPTGCSG